MAYTPNKAMVLTLPDKSATVDLGVIYAGMVEVIQKGITVGNLLARAVNRSGNLFYYQRTARAGIRDLTKASYDNLQYVDGDNTMDLVTLVVDQNKFTVNTGTDTDLLQLASGKGPMVEKWKEKEAGDIAVYKNSFTYNTIDNDTPSAFKFSVDFTAMTDQQFYEYVKAEIIKMSKTYDGYKNGIPRNKMEIHMAPEYIMKITNYYSHEGSNYQLLTGDTVFRVYNVEIIETDLLPSQVAFMLCVKGSVAVEMPVNSAYMDKRLNITQWGIIFSIGGKVIQSDGSTRVYRDAATPPPTPTDISGINTIAPPSTISASSNTAVTEAEVKTALDPNVLSAVQGVKGSLTTNDFDYSISGQTFPIDLSTATKNIQVTITGKNNATGSTSAISVTLPVLP